MFTLSHNETDCRSLGADGRVPERCVSVHAEMEGAALVKGQKLW